MPPGFCHIEVKYFRPDGSLIAFADVQSKLEESLGKPNSIHGNDYNWARVDGDKCAYLTLTKKADGNVESVEAGGMNESDRSFAACQKKS